MAIKDTKLIKHYKDAIKAFGLNDYQAALLAEILDYAYICGQIDQANTMFENYSNIILGKERKND